MGRIARRLDEIESKQKSARLAVEQTRGLKELLQNISAQGMHLNITHARGEMATLQRNVKDAGNLDVKVDGLGGMTFKKVFAGVTKQLDAVEVEQKKEHERKEIVRLTGEAKQALSHTAVNRP